ncbi:YacL family protein [Reinekea marinisedimentorum]|uniref:Uncharacterized protein n=1 Tax=Reinekea marinisedimentorum TaxID=230495 RepID=A0A4V2UJJ5_9GAMM|nr:YacL family protein [Reinekea marinisedimentorum]TCS40358.1 hypothetical protein BCF53_10967 [Reinekea marinisedimentorum]
MHSEVYTMDYEFSFDDFGQPLAEFSMGHELFGQWLSDEIGSSTERCTALIHEIEQLEFNNLGEKTLFGQRLTLTLSPQDAMIVGEEYDDADQTFLQDNGLEQQELQAECGLQDFKIAVVDWKVFIGE